MCIRDSAYLAPEVTEHNYDQSADVWSLGCIAYELCCLNVNFEHHFQHPFYRKETGDPTQAIREKTPDPIPSNYSKGLRDLIGICLLYTSPSPREQRGSRMPSSA
eukprot:TRINITY_DN20033_c0_g1_i1.p2 TRINITY_DN20033_c0_g1~~TRINITY_DN20033_c0_g1_i1.p2  ORF type:complete len:121 (+),score=49.54 TRINITY_DN20033_c0_g1_i1:49-363(+)